MRFTSTSKNQNKQLLTYINLYNLHLYLLIYSQYISCAAHRSAMRELALYKNLYYYYYYLNRPVSIFSKQMNEMQK